MSNLFDIKMVFTQIPDLLTYLPVTLELAVVAMIVSLILGLILALIKMKKIPVLKQIANLYISVIRGTPVLVVFNHPKSDRVREFFAKINRMVEPEYSI